MKTNRILLVVAILAFAVCSFAQGPGGGRGGRGYGGGPAQLLQRKDVQADLNLTDDQKTKLTALQDEMRPKMREAFQSANGDREAMRTAIEKITADMMKAVNDILTPQQQTRLKEINIQISGARVILQKDIQEALKLTDDQKAKIKSINDTATEANNSVRDKMRNQELDRESAMAAMKKNNDALNSELAKVLTEDQTAMLKKMAGAPFKADADQG